MKKLFRVRAAAEADLLAIVAVQSECVEAPQWSAAQYTGMMRSDREASLARAVFVADCEGEVGGYLVVSAAAGESELESVAVHPGARRQGVGRALCEASFRWAADAGARAMWLEVRAGSEGAQALYRKLGFVQTGTRRRYYACPPDDAVLMTANLLEDKHL